ncbi:uncharacterized protein E5676_scaffold152G00520 [Cucumis melo var. makuwa]|uniref:CCHC-type domain-containing protein n=1 Tax=Cucumis melo var. makuwa TaxID=1194695 RepID=A0A5D3CJX3_CUCMM|nr:uncharacterized protein E5676_scaffold152G00520 [Cucumis melo var. makuwa]
MQSQPLQNLGATVNLWFVLFSLSYPEGTKSTGFSSKPGGFLVLSDALSILEIHKLNQKLYLGPRGNRLSLQTGELDKTVIFSLSTLSVLRDNNAVIELPVPDTLPTSAESSGSNSSTWLELYFESVHVEMFCSFTNQVMSELHLVFNVSVGSTGIVRGDDVCWLHAVFRAKTVGGPGGGVTTWESSTQRGQIEAGSERFARSAHEIGRPERVGPSDPKKMYGIERLKKLGATVFEGSTDPADAEVWLNMLVKCFDVMSCPQKRKVRLATFLLQKEAEGWWKSIIVKRNDACTLDWQTFRGIFEEKYYPTTYCEAKRDEFLELKQGSLSVAEYERKYTELSRYAKVIVASKSDRCRSIVEEKSTMDLSRGVSTTSGIRGREQRRFTPGVNVSGCQDFKRRSGGKPLRQMSSGSAYQRQSQRASSQSVNSVAKPWTGQESVASESRRTPCVSCGKSHWGQCLVGAGVCYQCGQIGHFKSDCP